MAVVATANATPASASRGELGVYLRRSRKPTSRKRTRLRAGLSVHRSTGEGTRAAQWNRVQPVAVVAAEVGFRGSGWPDRRKDYPMVKRERRSSWISRSPPPRQHNVWGGGPRSDQMMWPLTAARVPDRGLRVG